MLGKLVTYNSKATSLRYVGFVILSSELHVTLIDAYFDNLIHYNVIRDDILEVAPLPENQFKHLQRQISVQESRKNLTEQDRELIRLVREALDGYTIIPLSVKETKNKVKAILRRLITWIYS